ncbi:hypothetical protein, partial [uncultured Faecalicoccus sp.]|uniref:hypothetical protein n=1 Tax=uncultured Faecalicoccus sp. TaxID=1971760 RepID=UPI0034530CA2
MESNASCTLLKKSESRVPSFNPIDTVVSTSNPCPSANCTIASPGLAATTPSGTGHSAVIPYDT